MANRASQIDAEVRAAHPGATVKRRGRSFIEFDLGGGKRLWEGTIEPLHTKGGAEIDTTWVGAVAPWSYQDASADYTAKIKAAFSNAPLLQFTDNTSGAWVTLQPQALNWHNDLNQIQQISAVQGVTASLSDCVATWAGAYGAGRDFVYVSHPQRLVKKLRLASALPAPAQYIIDGGNPVLQLQFLLAWSTNATVWVDGQQWDKSTAKRTTSAIEFRVNGTPVYRFDAPVATDVNGNTAAGLMRVRKAGANLYVEVRTPYSWLQSAAYPVEIDPTLALQGGADEGDDSYINANEATTNYGTNATLYVGDAVYSPNLTRSLIRFDVSGISSTATISSAVMSLWYSVNVSDEAFQNRLLRCFRLLTNWTESGVTWNTYNGANNWASAGGFDATDCEQTDIGSQTLNRLSPVNSRFDFDLAAAEVQEWISGVLANYGLLLKVDTESNDLFGFHSSDGASSEYRPLLEVVYIEAAVSDSSDLLLLGVG